MTDPVSLGLAGAAALVATAIAWLQWPRPPALDGERWFKLALCTLIRGRVEHDGGDVEAWEQAVVRFVPYHPAGRQPERKVSNPEAAVLPGAALPGEQALLEKLARLDTAPERWRWLYDEDAAGLDARLDDPAELGPAYDPGRALGEGIGWDAVAAWGAGDEAVADALRARTRARWVLIEGREGRGVPTVLDALEVLLPDTIRVGADEVGELEQRLKDSLESLEDRLVLVAEEAGAAAALQALKERADVRDQVVAVVAVGGVIGGRTDEQGSLSEAERRDWLDAWFAQRHLDTDVVRLTPYFSLQWLDREAWPPGVSGLPLQNARFPQPDAEGASAETVEVVDLGPLPVDPELPVELVARALWLVVSCWLASRR